MRSVMPVLVGLLLVAGAAAADMPFTDTFDQTYAVDHEVTVSLDNVNGDVTIQVWDQAEVRVEADKRASTAEALAELRIEVDASSSSIDIDTRYPSGRGHGASEVEYRLTVPRLARLRSVDLVNGSVVVNGVEGGASIDCVNGTLRVGDVAGRVELSAVNGNIEMSADVLRASDRFELESVNGTIDLYLAPSAGAEIEAETLNGNLSSDFGFEVHKGKFVGADMRGTIGGGGAEIELGTVNGAIAVHSR
jgi:DUF4097 and DUF4098 domain-containing protein YvlB